MSIFRQHAAELVAFGSISQPCGNPHGDSTQARMYTDWGFKGSDYPIIALDNTWRHDSDSPGARNDDKRMYYLCVARRSD